MAASLVVNAISDGTWFYGFAVFFLPLSRDLALSRAATSFPFAVKALIVALLGPPTGVWIDRAGPAQILRLSAVLAGLGYVLLSSIGGYGMFLGAIALITVGMLGFVPSTTTAVTRWAHRRRSLAVSIAHMGFTMGAAVIPPLLAFGVATVGWRVTVLLVGVGIWSIVIPVSRHLRGAPAMDPGAARATDSGSSANIARRAEARRPRLQAEGDVATALGSPAFWLMSLSLGLQGMVGTATSLHMVA